jgi:hypothetical protein
MAERLPGLTDPNLPAPQPAPSQQPNGSTPVVPTIPQAPPAHAPTALHPDRFSPPAKPSNDANSSGRNP